MQPTTMQESMVQINRKLDLIMQEIELQRRHRVEMEELKEDLLRVGKDVYASAVVELEEVHDSLKSGDISYLGKKLLRNVNNITRTFEMLESTKDLLQDLKPISREIFLEIMTKLDELDRKGYFAFFQELQNVVDNIVSSFSVEDVRKLGENIATILNTVKRLTQPDMLHTINNAISVYKNLDIEVAEDVSYLSLAKEMATPEARRGMAFAIRLLKNLAAHGVGSETAVPVRTSVN